MNEADEQIDCWPRTRSRPPPICTSRRPPRTKRRSQWRSSSIGCSRARQTRTQRSRAISSRPPVALPPEAPGRRGAAGARGFDDRRRRGGAGWLGVDSSAPSSLPTGRGAHDEEPAALSVAAAGCSRSPEWPRVRGVRRSGRFAADVDEEKRSRAPTKRRKTGGSARRRLPRDRCHTAASEPAENRHRPRDDQAADPARSRFPRSSNGASAEHTRQPVTSKSATRRERERRGERHGQRVTVRIASLRDARRMSQRRRGSVCRTVRSRLVADERCRRAERDGQQQLQQEQGSPALHATTVSGARAALTIQQLSFFAAVPAATPPSSSPAPSDWSWPSSTPHSTRRVPGLRNGAVWGGELRGHS